MIIAVQLLEGDLLHILGAAHAAYAVALTGAHFFQQPPGGIGTFVVDIAADKVRQIFPFALHVFLQQPPAPGDGGAVKLSQQVRQLLQQFLALWEKAVVHAAGNKAEELVFTLLAYRRLQPCAVEHIQFPADGGHIRTANGAPVENVDQQSVASGGLLLQRGGHLGAQEAGFEFLGGNVSQVDVVHQQLSSHGRLSFFCQFRSSIYLFDRSFHRGTEYFSAEA